MRDTLGEGDSVTKRHMGEGEGSVKCQVLFEMQLNTNMSSKLFKGNLAYDHFEF